MELTERMMPLKGRLVRDACSSHSGGMDGKRGEGKADRARTIPMEEETGEMAEGHEAAGGVIWEAKNANPGQLKLSFRRKVIGQASQVIQGALQLTEREGGGGGAFGFLAVPMLSACIMRFLVFMR